MLSVCRETNQWYEINCALKLRKWKRILNPVEHLRWSVLRKIVPANCFRKTLHLRCLTGLWIRLWPFSRFSKKKLSQKSFKHKILYFVWLLLVVVFTNHVVFTDRLMCFQLPWVNSSYHLANYCTTLPKIPQSTNHCIQRCHGSTGFRKLPEIIVLSLLEQIWN